MSGRVSLKQECATKWIAEEFGYFLSNLLTISQKMFIFPISLGLPCPDIHIQNAHKDTSCKHLLSLLF